MLTSTMSSSISNGSEMRRYNLACPCRWSRSHTTSGWGPRLLKLGQQVAQRWVYARKDLPAGSGFNDAMVKAYGLRAFDKYTAQEPASELQSFIDDNGVFRHGPWENIKPELMRAARALASYLQQDMEVVLAVEKLQRLRLVSNC